MRGAPPAGGHASGYPDSGTGRGFRRRLPTASPASARLVGGVMPEIGLSEERILPAASFFGPRVPPRSLGRTRRARRDQSGIDPGSRLLTRCPPGGVDSGLALRSVALDSRLLLANSRLSRSRQTRCLVVHLIRGAQSGRRLFPGFSRIHGFGRHWGGSRCLRRRRHGRHAPGRSRLGVCVGPADRRGSNR